MFFFSTADRNSSGRLDIPQGFSLGPARLSCQLVTSHDNDVVDESQRYRLILLDGDHPFITTSDTTVTITNNDSKIIHLSVSGFHEYLPISVVRVGFVATEYEVHPGDMLDICVVAIATERFEKVVSIDLTLSAGSSGNNYNYTVCTKFCLFH